MRKHPLAVLGGETRPVQRDAERLADAPRILKILGRGAVGVLVVLPVGHEQALDRHSPHPCSSSAATAESTPPDMPTMTVPAESKARAGEGIAPIIPLYRRVGRAHARAAGYISICRICDSCMLVCQTSSKKFR